MITKKANPTAKLILKRLLSGGKATGRVAIDYGVPVGTGYLASDALVNQAGWDPVSAGISGVGVASFASPRMFLNAFRKRRFNPGLDPLNNMMEVIKPQLKTKLLFGGGGALSSSFQNIVDITKRVEDTANRIDDTTARFAGEDQWAAAMLPDGSHKILTRREYEDLLGAAGLDKNTPTISQPEPSAPLVGGKFTKVYRTEASKAIDNLVGTAAGTLEAGGDAQKTIRDTANKLETTLGALGADFRAGMGELERGARSIEETGKAVSKGMDSVGTGIAETGKSLQGLPEIGKNLGIAEQAAALKDEIASARGDAVSAGKNLARNLNSALWMGGGALGGGFLGNALAKDVDRKRGKSAIRNAIITLAGAGLGGYLGNILQEKTKQSSSPAHNLKAASLLGAMTP